MTRDLLALNNALQSSAGPFAAAQILSSLGQLPRALPPGAEATIGVKRDEGRARVGVRTDEAGALLRGEL